MSVKIRLMRIGAKSRPFYRVVAVDERNKRTGQYLELLGTYNPLTEPKEIKLNQELIDTWIKKGAQPSHGFLRIIGKAPQKPPRKAKKDQGKAPEATPAAAAAEEPTPEEETVTDEAAAPEETTAETVNSENTTEVATTETTSQKENSSGESSEQQPETNKGESDQTEPTDSDKKEVEDK